MICSAGLIVAITCTFYSILLSFLLMAVHKPVAKAGIYFITFTCFKWLHLVGKTNAYDVVCSFFSNLNQKGHQLVGYTIMSNLVHLLLFFGADVKSLNTVIGNLKRFIGCEEKRATEYRRICGLTFQLSNSIKLFSVLMYVQADKETFTLHYLKLDEILRKVKDEQEAST